MKKLTYLDKLKQIPTLPGIYVFFNINNIPLYVGTSVNLQKRIKDHFKRVDNVNLLEISFIHYWIFEDISGKQRIQLEKAFIKKYQPKYNQNLHDIVAKTDRNNFIPPKELKKIVIKLDLLISELIFH